MNVLFLITHTPNCEPFWRSLEAVGHKVHVELYDDRPHDRHQELVELARTLKPDFAVYIGAYAPSHKRPVPSTDILSQIRATCPFILLCGDAADDPWWPVLEDYHQKDCFDAMVAIDGSFNTPIKEFAEGLTLLTPLDPRVYRPWPWGKRTITTGMIGGLGGLRGQIVYELSVQGLIDYRLGPIGRSYADYATLLCLTKITLNFAQTGTGKYLHVKGRVVEAGFAGSTVLETKGSPLKEWGFVPGEDYFEYEGLEDLVDFLKNVPDELVEKMASKFTVKMTVDHNPWIFWGKVLAKAGVLV